MILRKQSDKRLESRLAVLERALDEPWAYDGDETEEELWAEMLTIEKASGRTDLWPHTDSAVSLDVRGRS